MKKVYFGLLIFLVILIILMVVLNLVAYKKIKSDSLKKIEFKGPPPGSLPYVKGPKLPPPYFQPEP